MKTTIICILIAALSITFAVGAFIENVKTKRELKNLKKQEGKNEKIDQEAINNIDAVAGGDVHAGNNILHQLAEKRK